MTDARPVSPLLLCARQELMLAVRSRWTQIFAAVFGALSLGVAASGYVLSGGAGVQDFARTAASLVQLVLLLTPLTALVIGVLALAPERGSVEMLFSQPVARRTILGGRLLGLFAALGAAQAIGLGGAGLLIFSRSGNDGLGGYALLFAGALVLTAVFLGIAALLVSGGVGRRARALALALIVWFAGVVLFDVAALGLASLLPSGAASRLLIIAVLVNPIDAVRTGALLGIQGTTAFGAASLAFLRFTKGPSGAAALLALSALAWILVPAALAARRLERADL
jgi:Cu-processing system permease protein